MQQPWISLSLVLSSCRLVLVIVSVIKTTLPCLPCVWVSTMHSNRGKQVQHRRHSPALEKGDVSMVTICAGTLGAAFSASLCEPSSHLVLSRQEQANRQIRREKRHGHTLDTCKTPDSDGCALAMPYTETSLEVLLLLLLLLLCVCVCVCVCVRTRINYC